MVKPPAIQGQGAVTALALAIARKVLTKPAVRLWRKIRGAR